MLAAVAVAALVLWLVLRPGRKDAIMLERKMTMRHTARKITHFLLREMYPTMLSLR